jgi:nucleoside-diphosphate-sugar epimerase
MLAGVIRAPDDYDLIKQNVTMVANLLHSLSTLAVIPPVFFLSSIHVYPKSPEIHRATDAIVLPRNAYGCAKHLCECLLKYFAAQYNFPLWIGRAANIVATEEPINRLSFIHDFRTSWTHSKSIRVNKQAVRDLVDVSDFAGGLLRRIREVTAQRGIHLENVCTGRAVSLYQIARIAARIAVQEKKEIRVEEFDGGEPDILVAQPESDRVWGNGPNLDRLAHVIIH